MMMRSLRRVVLVGLSLGLTVSSAAAAQPMDHARPLLTLAELKHLYADPAYRFADIDGVQVAYKDEGHGQAILLVHGSVSTLKTWDVVAPILVRHYRVIRYDIPPGGLSGSVSDRAAATLTPVDIAEGLLAKLDVTQATIVGVSSGGTLGIFLAAKRPDLVQRLILSNTPSDPVDPSHMTLAPSWAEAMKQAHETKFLSQHYWDEFLNFFSGEPERIGPEIRRQYYDFNRRLPEQHPLALVAQVANHAKAVAAMAQVKAPTLLVWGASDPLLTPKTADILAGYLSNAQISKIMMPDVGHYPPLEVPTRFARIVELYIEAVTPGPMSIAHQ